MPNLPIIHVFSIKDPDIELDPTKYFDIESENNHGFYDPKEDTIILAFQYGQDEDGGVHLSVLVDSMDEPIVTGIVPYPAPGKPPKPPWSIFGHNEVPQEEDSHELCDRCNDT